MTQASPETAPMPLRAVGAPPGGADARVRAVNLGVVLVPFAGLVVAVALLWGTAFDWVHLGIMALMYVTTALGITIGYHRLFTHRSFAAPRPVAGVLAALGSMAAEGPLLQWVATHRRHHQHSDEEDDPHSPHTHADGALGMLGGFWHAHLGWIFASHTFVRSRGRASRVPPELARYVKDLRRDPMLRWMHEWFPMWVLLGLAIPAALGGAATLSWSGAFLGFVWGGLVRIFLLHHVTWSINSICHMWGSRPFRSHDESRNNAIFGVLALGEGWHNNHHAFPTSARHGLRWWQLDVSYLVIRAMAAVGLARGVRVPSPARQAAKRAA